MELLTRTVGSHRCCTLLIELQEYVEKGKKMELLREDLKWCVRRLPKDVKKLLMRRERKLFVAGGFIRACIAGEKVNDIDMFVTHKDFAEVYANQLVNDKLAGGFAKEKGRLLVTANAITVYGNRKVAVQFIHKWVFEKPEDVIPSFDFTIAKAILWFSEKEWHSQCDDRFYQDLAAKRLIYTSPKRVEEVGGSMLRVLKFYQKGYRIPLDSLGAVIARAMTGIRFNDETAATEEDWAKILCGLFRVVDPDVDPLHIAHMPATDETEKAEETE